MDNLRRRRLPSLILAFCLLAPAAWSAPAARPTLKPLKPLVRPTTRPVPTPAADDGPEVRRWQKALDQAASDNPWSDAYFQAGLSLIKAYRDVKKPREATRVGEDLLAKYDLVIDAKKALSELLEKKEKPLAEREYVTAAKLAFQRDELLALLGEIYTQAGQREQAALHYAQIIQSQPDSDLAKKALEQLRQLGWFSADMENK